MTNQPHTPTATQIREDYAHLRYHFADGWSIGEERVQFDNWLTAEIAAAEQRGAERVEQAIRERHVPNDDGVCRACLLRFVPCPSLADAQKIVRSYRVDQEGDND